MSNPLCECPLAGFCSRHKMYKSAADHQACRGESSAADGGRKHWIAWERGLLGATAPASPVMSPPRFTARGIRTIEVTPEIQAVRQSDAEWRLSTRAKNSLARMNHRPLIGKPINRDRLQSHIIYHVMPLAGDTEWVWRRHCDWLREVRSEWAGRLVIGIVTPGPSDEWKYCPPDAVREALSGLDAEFIEAPNDTGGGKKRVRQGIGEGVLFPKMLGMLKTSSPDQVAFYGHCKGVSRPRSPLDSAVHLWAEAMFETVFRNRDAAISALDTHGVCGSFRMRGGYRDGTPGIGSFWFFSGTFFGIRLADAFKTNWDYMSPHYGCVEQWPRLNFDQHTQSACLFFDEVTNLYDEQYWKSVVTPAFEKWKERRCSTC